MVSGRSDSKLNIKWTAKGVCLIVYIKVLIIFIIGHKSLSLSVISRLVNYTPTLNVKKTRIFLLITCLVIQNLDGYSIIQFRLINNKILFSTF